MARRKKTKTSPVSWRLDDDALKALAILENQQPDKERGQIVGEHLIKAAGDEPPPLIRFNEFSPSEILHLRADMSENKRTAEDVKIALRKARPGSKEEAKRLSDAITEATKILVRCSQHDKELRELARKTAHIRAEEIAALEWAYKGASRQHELAVKKIGEEEDAKVRAEAWAKLAQFCLIFRPDLGPELKTPIAFSPAPQQKVQVSTQGQQIPILKSND